MFKNINNSYVFVSTDNNRAAKSYQAALIALRARHPEHDERIERAANALRVGFPAAEAAKSHPDMVNPDRFFEAAAKQLDGILGDDAASQIVRTAIEERTKVHFTGFSTRAKDVHHIACTIKWMLNGLKYRSGEKRLREIIAIMDLLSMNTHIFVDYNSMKFAQAFGLTYNYDENDDIINLKSSLRDYDQLRVAASMAAQMERKYASHISECPACAKLAKQKAANKYNPPTVVPEFDQYVDKFTSDEAPEFIDGSAPDGE